MMKYNIKSCNVCEGMFLETDAARNMPRKIGVFVEDCPIVRETDGKLGACPGSLIHRGTIEVSIL